MRSRREDRRTHPNRYMAHDRVARHTRPSRSGARRSARLRWPARSVLVRTGRTLTEFLAVIAQSVAAGAVAPVPEWDLLTRSAAIVVVMAAFWDRLDDFVHRIEIRYLWHGAPPDYRYGYTPALDALAIAAKHRIMLGPALPR